MPVGPWHTSGLVEPHASGASIEKCQDEGALDPGFNNLRGEAYIHGIMRGELFEETEPQWQEIILRLKACRLLVS